VTQLPRSDTARLAFGTYALGIRLVGAALGGVLAFAVMVGLYLATAEPTVQQLLGVRLLLGIDGIALGSPAFLVGGWLVAPAAGTVSGWLLAEHAAGGRRWAGAWMGACTFGLAITFAVALVSVGTGGDIAASASQLAAIAPILILAGTLLAPLLPICLASGVLWERMFRTINPRLGFGQRSSDRALPIMPIVIVGVLLMLSWAALLGSWTPFDAAGID
jgi:hypothetical protein